MELEQPAHLHEPAWQTSEPCTEDLPLHLTVLLFLPLPLLLLRLSLSRWRSFPFYRSGICDYHHRGTASRLPSSSLLPLGIPLRKGQEKDEDLGVSSHTATPAWLAVSVTVGAERVSRPALPQELAPQNAGWSPGEKPV